LKDLVARLLLLKSERTEGVNHVAVSQNGERTGGVNHVAVALNGERTGGVKHVAVAGRRKDGRS
jgi:hypothetical protein